MSIIALIPASDNRVIFKGTDGCLVLKDKKPIQILDRGINGEVASVNGLTGHVIIDTSDIDLAYGTSSAVNALRVVYTNDAGEVSHADSSNINHIARVTGVAVTAAGIGGMVKVKSLGRIEDASFSFTPGNLLYFDSTGKLIDTAPATGFFQVVGRVETSTRVFINIEEPLNLN